MADQRNRATYAAIVGGRTPSPRTEPADFLSSLNLVVKTVGSVNKAWQALGVPRRTLRRWLDGAEPPADRKQLVMGVAARLTRRTRLKPRRESRLRGATSIRIKGVDRYDGSARTVTFRVGGGAGSTGIDAGLFGDLVDAFLAGTNAIDNGRSTDGLFALVPDHMLNDWYREHFRNGDPDGGIDVHSVTIR